MVQEFLERCKKDGYVIKECVESGDIELFFSCCNHWRIKLIKEEGFYIPFCYFEADDYHNQDFALILPILLASYSKVSSGVTYRFMSLNTGFCGDVLGGMAMFPCQPLNEKIRLLSPEDFELMHSILTDILFIHQVESEIFENEAKHQYFEMDSFKDWGDCATKIIGEKRKVDYILNFRNEPNWYYFRDLKTGLGIIKSSKFTSMIKFLSEAISDKSKYLEGISSTIEIYGSKAKNIIPKQGAKKATKILNKLEHKAGVVDFITHENILIVTGVEHILFLEFDCSHHAYNKELMLLAERRSIENYYLFSDRNFEWNINCRNDSADFENLTLELLEREPWIYSPKKVAPTQQGDNGRDIICTFDKKYSKNNMRASHINSKDIGNMIVQCKTKLKKSKQQSVARADVSLECLTDYQPDGYLLVVNTQITTALTEALEKQIARHKNMKIDWWLSYDLEDRLRKNPDILNRYKHIVDYIN